MSETKMRINHKSTYILHPQLLLEIPCTNQLIQQTNKKKKHKFMCRQNKSKTFLISATYKIHYSLSTLPSFILTLHNLTPFAFHFYILTPLPSPLSSPPPPTHTHISCSNRILQTLFSNIACKL